MATQKEEKISVGDRVRFMMGGTFRRAVVLEDRGALGVGKRRIFRLQEFNDPYDDDDVTFELPEDMLEVVKPDETDIPITTQEAMEYLKYGGLIQILRARMTDGKTHAWLCRDNLENVTHTFSPERGMFGGALIPLSAFRDSRVFEPKRNEVLTFLTAFGLSQDEAEQVLGTVGTAA